jgi:hypothetical protein
MRVGHDETVSAQYETGTHTSGLGFLFWPVLTWSLPRRIGHGHTEKAPKQFLHFFVLATRCGGAWARFFKGSDVHDRRPDLLHQVSEVG